MLLLIYSPVSHLVRRPVCDRAPRLDIVLALERRRLFRGLVVVCDRAPRAQQPVSFFSRILGVRILRNAQAREQ